MSDDDWKDDLLDGAEKIQAFLEHENVSRTYYMLRKKMLPAAKVGAHWIASKSAIKEHFAKLTRGE